MKKLLAFVVCSLFASQAFAQEPEKVNHRLPVPPLIEVSRDTLMLTTTYETASGEIKTEKVLTVEVKMKQTTEFLLHYPVYFPESRVKWRETRTPFKK